MADVARAWARRPTTGEAEEGEGETCGLCAPQGAPFGCCVACSAGWVCGGQASLEFGADGAEKLSAELEQRAAVEAEALVTPDGAVCRERLALLRASSQPSFVQRVLSRVPFAALMELPASDTDAEALNTALLLEDFREIRQWQTAAPAASPAVRSIFPFRLHSLFEQAELLDVPRLLPAEFEQAHPHLSPPTGAGEGRMANLAEFRALLRTFSMGILEGLPLDPDRLIIGGSVMPLCVRRLTAAQRSLCHAEIGASRAEAQLLARLAKLVGETPATLIMWMAMGEGAQGEGGGASGASGERRARSPPAPRGRKGAKIGTASAVPSRAGALRSAIRGEIVSEAWEDADVDLFVIGEDAEETIRKAVAVLQRNINAVTGYRGSVVMQTKNTLTVVGGWPLPNVQIVYKTVRSAQELLVHSDVDCTALAYDGECIWAATRALRALLTGYNFIPKQVVEGSGLRSGRSAVRFGKYLKRGWGVLVFEHCRHLPRCDHSLSAGALEGLRKKKSPKEPRDLRGSPAQRGRALAEWMHRISPQLRRRSAEADGAEEAASSPKDDGTGLLAHRLVPGDRDEPAEKGAGKGKGRGKGAERDDGAGSGSGAPSGGPLRRYFQFADLVIPRGPDVCAATLREYAQRLGRPDLLREVAGLDAAIEPKTASDRQQWLDRLRGKCYMCRVAVRTKEQWPLCTDCAAFNQRKREEPIDGKGMVAMVTGGRTKIGRECALRLLRAGATVVTTSRFPRCARDRYAQEEDFADFAERLHILAADFRRLQSVQRLVELVVRRFERLDVLVHNAAQTIRRPPAWYEALVRREEELGRLEDGEAEAEAEAPGGSAGGSDGSEGFVNEAMALLPAALPGGLPLLSSDAEAEARKAEWFPPSQTDAHGEQLDLRAATSWTQQIEDTEMPELVEVLAVNLVVPYLLTAKLLPLLRKASYAFVVFVTSSEGSFTTPSGGKNSTHPHTNAAKAGLNMLAKTIAGDLRRQSIFTSAVDPGWVSWMKPGGSQAVEGAPLTEADGAARVLEPIVGGMRAIRANRCPPVGVLFKDFRVAPW